METTVIAQQARMLLIALWARLNWKTTLLGVLSATAVVLQRIPDASPHWQDVVAAVALTVLGALGVDPNRLPAGETTASALLSWAQINWQTTLAGVVTAGVVVLQRDGMLHWQDGVAALLLTALGALAVDPHRVPVPSVAPRPATPADPPAPSPSTPQ
jgi:hypothetical protein